MRDRRFHSIVKEDKAAFEKRFAADRRAAEEKKALLRLAEKKESVSRPQRRQLLFTQLRYMGAWGYAAQALGFFCALAAIGGLQARGVLAARQLPVIAAFWMIFSTAVVVAGLTTAFTNRMGELEAVCYFNLGQIICVRLVWGGAGHLCAMAAFLIFFAEKTGLRLGETGVYLGLVWLLANTVYFFVFAAVRGKGRQPALLAAAMLLAVCAWLPLLWEDFMRLLSSGVCAVFAALCLAALAGELAYVFRGIEKGEFVCFD